MSDMTPTVAMSTAPASADRTAIIAAADALLATLDNAVTSGRLNATVNIQLKSEIVDTLERIAPNLSA